MVRVGLTHQHCSLRELLSYPWTSPHHLQESPFKLSVLLGGGLKNSPLLSVLLINTAAKRTVIIHLEFCPPLQDSPFKLSVLLGGSLKNSPLLSALLIDTAAKRTVIRLEFCPPLQESPFKPSVLLGGSLKNSPFSSAL